MHNNLSHSVNIIYQLKNFFFLMMLPETTLKTRSDQIKTLCKKLRKIKVRSTLASMFLQDAKAENILVSFRALNV